MNVTERFSAFVAKPAYYAKTNICKQGNQKNPNIPEAPRALLVLQFFVSLVALKFILLCGLVETLCNAVRGKEWKATVGSTALSLGFHILLAFGCLLAAFIPSNHLVKIAKIA